MSQSNVHPFILVITQSNVDPILIIFGTIAAEKNCSQMTYSFLIVSSLCMNITELKNERFCMLLMLPLRLAVVPVSCSFSKSLFSPCSAQSFAP